MLTEQVNIKVPATTMLAGEHAVVYQGGAIACSLDLYMHFQWEPNLESKKLSLYSGLGQVHYDFKTQKFSCGQEHWSYFKLVVQNLVKLGSLPGGTLRVKSQFSSVQGLGSSSAFVIGVLKALNHSCHFASSSKEILELALKITRQKSPLASGTDLATCLYEGVIYFEPEGSLVKRVPLKEQWCTLTYCGYKTPTPKVLELVREKIKSDKSLYKILDQISSLTEQLAHQSPNLTESKINEILSYHQECQVQLGVVDSTLSQITESMRQDKALYGVKVSGSGLGDCVMGLGQTSQQHTSSLPKSSQKTYRITLPS